MLTTVLLHPMTVGRVDDLCSECLLPSLLEATFAVATPSGEPLRLTSFVFCTHCGRQ